MFAATFTAEEIAYSMGLQLLALPVGAKRGNKAKFAQYIRREEGRNVCMAEVINAKRSKYMPHQGARECARRRKAAL